MPVVLTAGRVAVLNTRKYRRSVYEEKSELRNSRWFMDFTVSRERVVYTVR